MTARDYWEQYRSTVKVSGIVMDPWDKLPMPVQAWWNGFFASILAVREPEVASLQARLDREYSEHMRAQAQLVQAHKDLAQMVEQIVNLRKEFGAILGHRRLTVQVGGYRCINFVAAEKHPLGPDDILRKVADDREPAHLLVSSPEMEEGIEAAFNQEQAWLPLPQRPLNRPQLERLRQLRRIKPHGNTDQD